MVLLLVGNGQDGLVMVVGMCVSVAVVLMSGCGCSWGVRMCDFGVVIVEVVMR